MSSSSDDAGVLSSSDDTTSSSSDDGMPRRLAGSVPSSSRMPSAGFNKNVVLSAGDSNAFTLECERAGDTCL